MKRRAGTTRRLRARGLLAVAALLLNHCGRVGYTRRDASVDTIDSALEVVDATPDASDDLALEVSPADAPDDVFDAEVSAPLDSREDEAATEVADPRDAADVADAPPDEAPLDEAAMDAAEGEEAGPADASTVFDDGTAPDADGPEVSDAPSDGDADADLRCPGPFQAFCGGGCVDTSSDPMNCGACGLACGMGTCGLGVCSPPLAPRPIAPLSTSILRRRRPVLRWALFPGVTGAQVEVCADRACTSVEATFDAEGTSGSPPAALAEGVHFWRMRGRNGAAVGTAVSPTWEFFLRGPDAPFDAPQGFVTDVNGDGKADALFGAPGAGAPAVYIASSSQTQTTAERAVSLALTVQVPGPPGTMPRPVGASFGRAMAYLGDVNGDGYGDFAAGAPDESSGCGAVFVAFGGPVLSVGTVLFVSLLCDTPGEAQGSAVASAGDFDEDGFGDMLVGAPHYSSTASRPNEGRVKVLLGASSIAGFAFGIFPSPSGEAEGAFGSSLAGAADFDGDGHTDVVISAPGAAGTRGEVYLYRGGRPRFEDVLSDTYRGTSVGEFAGQSLALQGDLDGDGRADLAVGAPGAASMAGEVRVLLGNAGPSAWLSGAGAQVVSVPRLAGVTGGFGRSVAYVGDIDGDGDTEFVASARTLNGVLELCNGAPTVRTASTIDTVLGLPLNFRASAFTLAGPGDLTGDGRPDVFIGLPAIDEVMAFPGAAGGTGGAFGAFSVLRLVSTMPAAHELGTSVAGRGVRNRRVIMLAKRAR